MPSTRTQRARVIVGHTRPRAWNFRRGVDVSLGKGTRCREFNRTHAVDVIGPDDGMTGGRLDDERAADGIAEADPASDAGAIHLCRGIGSERLAMY